MSTRLMALVMIFVVAPVVRAENWPQWRGPGSQGISSEAGIPVEWGTDRNIAWKVQTAGLGGLSPVVWGDLVVITSQIGNSPVSGGAAQPLLARDDTSLAQRENAMGGRRGRGGAPRTELFAVVEAYNRIDGKRLWEYRAEVTGDLSENHEKHNLATPTPIIDGERIYAWYGSGQVFALDLSGKLIWKRHLGEEYGRFTNNWGHGSSPAIHNDLLILLCDHDSNAYLLALDKSTGKERWKVDRGRDRISHSTPFVVPGPAGPEMIINSSRRIDAFNPTTGELLWHADGERQTPIPTPVFHEGMIYLSRGYRNSDYLAIQPGGKGDVTATHIKWREQNAASYVPSIIQYQGLLYMTNEVGVLTCADAKTGQRVWRHRLDGVFFASPVAAEGRIYMQSETGDMFVLKAGRTAEVIAQNKLDDRFIASPAISSGHIFLRGDRTLFSIGK